MSSCENAIFWHVYPLGFTGAEIRPERPSGVVEHRLGRLTGWLDHAVGMGFTGLLLGPIFASTSHGYDTIDHLRIDPRLGDDADFDILVREAHARGLKVVLDGVFNHVGTQHPAFQAALAGGPEGRLFRWTDGQLVTFEGHGGLATLNHDEPDVVAWVDHVMRYWLARGADGWRLDASYAVAPAFWRRVIPGVREEFPDAWFLGEVIHGDYAAFVAGSSVDTVTQYELWKATWSALKDANFFELAWTLKRHQEFAQTFVPQTFVGNHDVERIASQVGSGRAVLAAAVLFTVPGTPSVYAGDEYAFEAVKGEGWASDDPLRPAFPDTPAGLDGAGAWMAALYHELIELRRERPWLIRGRIEQGELANERFTYEVVGDGGRLRIDLALAPVPSVVITENGRRLFQFTGGAA